jgi:cell division protein FtsN
MAAAPAAPTAAAAAPAGDAAGVRVQIGAFSSAALADRGWSDVAALMPGGMGGKGKHVEAVSKGAQTLYRTSVTGFSDRAAAAAFCDALKAKGKICFVKS